MSTAQTPTAVETISEASAADHMNAAASTPNDALEQLHLPDVPPPPTIVSLTPLRSLREGQGRSVEDIASALRLSQAQINALEDKRWDALPGAAYVKGFLRNYARHLGIDAQPYIDEYTAQTQPNPQQHAAIGQPVNAPNPLATSPVKKAVLAHAEVLKNDPPALQSFSPSGEEKAPTKGLASIVALLIAATLAFLLYWERGLWLPKVAPYFKTASAWFDATPAVLPQTSTPAVTTSTAPGAAANSAPDTTPVAEATTNTPEAPVPTVSNPAPSTALTTNTGVKTDAAQSVVAGENSASAVTAAAVAPPNTAAVTVRPSDVKKPATGPIRALVLQLNKTAWIEVRDSSNNVLYYGTKPAGAQTIKGNAPLSIVIGAADAVTLKVDGQGFDVQSKAQGNVARFNIP